jgi:hypothetical protein
MTPGSAIFMRLARPGGEFIRRQSVRNPGSWAAVVVLVAVAISLFSRFPVYTDPSAKFPGNFVAFPSTSYGRAITWWLDHPFRPVPAAEFFTTEEKLNSLVVGSISHADKLAYRGFLPLLNQLIGAGFWTLVGANHLAVVMTFWLIYLLCRRTTGDAALATMATWTYAATWAGSWGFNDRVCGDAVAIAWLLGAIAVRPGWLVALQLLMAGLCDERAIIAAPLVALFRWWEQNPPLGAADRNDPVSTSPRAVARAVLGGVLAYLACRGAVSWAFNLHPSSSMMADSGILLYHFFVSYPAAIFGVFEFLWIFPVLLIGSCALAPAAGPRWAGAFALALLLAAAPGFLVWDIERSLCYLLPGILAAIIFSPKNEDGKFTALAVIFVTNLLWLAPNASVLRFFVF